MIWSLTNVKVSYSQKRQYTSLLASNNYQWFTTLVDFYHCMHM